MKWLSFVLGESRGVRNALTRLPTIINRFGITPHRSETQLEALLGMTDHHGVRPTLAVTAVTARRNPQVLQKLAGRGVELAAHGYVHNDYASLSAEEQRHHVQRARDELMALGFQVRGWRCPYSRWNADTLTALRLSGFAYDATPVYAWPAYEEENIPIPSQAAADYQRLCALFGVLDASQHSVLPTMVDGLVQIPMSIPQDEDMVDRLHLEPTIMSRVWTTILRWTHDREEVFVLCLHPERASLCARPLDDTLMAARDSGDVWIATLGEIADWWRVRDTASVTVQADGEGRWRVSTEGPRDLAMSWRGQSIAGPGSLTIEAPRKPMVHCGPRWSGPIRQQLRDAGYLTSDADGATAYAVDLDKALPPTTTPQEVVQFVRNHHRDLVRIQPWPAGFRSCLSVSGDIDALTLFDFAMRLKEF